MAARGRTGVMRITGQLSGSPGVSWEDLPFPDVSGGESGLGEGGGESESGEARWLLTKVLVARVPCRMLIIGDMRMLLRSTPELCGEKGVAAFLSER